MLRGDPTQPHAFVGEKDRGASEEKLAELENRVEAPALKKEDAAAEQAHGGEEDVVIPGQGWLEAPHEVEESPTHRQHNADDAGPVQTGVDHWIVRCREGLSPL